MSWSTSGGEEQNNSPTGAVSILGTPIQGQTLTISNTLADEDGIGTFSYQWQADGVDIDGATAGSLTITQAHVGTALNIVVSYTDSLGNEEAVSSDPTEVVTNTTDDTSDSTSSGSHWSASVGDEEDNHSPTGSITINGPPIQGEILTITSSLADEDGLGIVSYQWQSDGVDISGAIDDELLLSQEFVGSKITVVASYTDDQGTDESVTSYPTRVVTQDASIRVQDGYVSNAKIYIDVNGNGLADKEEFTGVLTDENGEFTLDTTAQGNIIAVGGMNTDTHLPNALDLIAPEGSSIISPVTALLSSLIDHEGLTQEQANSEILSAFGLDNTIRLTFFDPLNDSNSGPAALSLQKLNVHPVCSHHVLHNASRISAHTRWRGPAGH